MHLEIEFLVRGEVERAWIVVAEQRRFLAWCAPGFGGLRPWRGRRAVVRLRNDTGRPDEAEVAAPAGAGEQISLQREQAEDAASHAEQDGRQVLRAEDGGDGGELRLCPASGGGCREILAIGDQGADDMEDRADPSKDGAGCCGGEGDGFRLVWAGSVASGALCGGCRLHGSD